MTHYSRTPNVIDLLDLFRSNKVSVLEPSYRHFQCVKSKLDLKQITRKEFGFDFVEGDIDLAAQHLDETGEWKILNSYFYDVNLYKNVQEVKKLTPPLHVRMDEVKISDISRQFLSRFDEERVRLFYLGSDLAQKQQLFYKQNRGIGYIPNKDIVYFAYNLPAIGHEIAHMVEMQDIKRCIIDDWALSSSSLEKKNNRNLFRSFVREFRVWTIESRIFNPSLKELKELPNKKLWLDDVERRLPYGRFETKSHLDDWMWHFQTTTFQSYPIDRVINDWNVRVDFIKNWMES